MAVRGAVFAVFVRQPIPGQVKSRLAASIGDGPTAEFYRACVRDVLSSIGRSCGCGVLAYTPASPAAREACQQLAPAGWRLWSQPAGSLGERLQACIAQQFSDGAERVIVVGSDSPSLPSKHLFEAAERLLNQDVVLGPALDGGYYLIGLRRPDAKQAASWRLLFEGIDWGGPRVLGQTVARLTEAGLSAALLPPWYDVDTVDDLQFLRSHLQAMAAAGQDCPCPQTAAWLAGWESE